MTHDRRKVGTSLVFANSLIVDQSTEFPNGSRKITPRAPGELSQLIDWQTRLTSVLASPRRTSALALGNCSSTLLRAFAFLAPLSMNTRRTNGGLDSKARRADPAWV